MGRSGESIEGTHVSKYRNLEEEATWSVWETVKPMWLRTSVRRKAAGNKIIEVTKVQMT